MTTPQLHSTYYLLLSLLIGLTIMQLAGMLTVAVGTYHAFAELLPTSILRVALLTFVVEVLLVMMLVIESFATYLEQQGLPKQVKQVATISAWLLGSLSAGAIYLEMAGNLQGLPTNRYVFGSLEFTAALLGPLFVLVNLLVAKMIGHIIPPFVATRTQLTAMHHQEAEAKAQQRRAEMEQRQREIEAKAEREHRRQQEREEAQHRRELQKLETQHRLSRPAPPPSVSASTPSAETITCEFNCGWSSSTHSPGKDPQRAYGGHKRSCPLNPASPMYMSHVAPTNGHHQGVN